MYRFLKFGALDRSSIPMTRNENRRYSMFRTINPIKCAVKHVQLFATLLCQHNQLFQAERYQI